MRHSPDLLRSSRKAAKEKIRWRLNGEALSFTKAATQLRVAQGQALKKGMEEKAREFAQKGSELYAEARNVITCQP